MKKIELLPSLLAFDKNEWVDDFKTFKVNGIDYIHYDVMDQGYVNNTAFNEIDYKIFLNNHQGLKSHVHLMVLNPLEDVKKYFYKQTDAICFHFDVLEPLLVIKCLQIIKEQNIKAGIAISPNFNINDFEQYLPYCDLVTIMGVFPGKGGQKFIESTIGNIKAIIEYNKINNRNIMIEIDGGMNFETIPLIYNQSNYIVAGSFLKKHIDQIYEIMQWFKSL